MTTSAIHPHNTSSYCTPSNICHLALIVAAVTFCAMGILGLHHQFHPTALTPLTFKVMAIGGGTLACCLGFIRLLHSSNQRPIIMKEPEFDFTVTPAIVEPRVHDDISSVFAQSQNTLQTPNIIHCKIDLNQVLKSQLDLIDMAASILLYAIRHQHASVPTHTERLRGEIAGARKYFGNAPQEFVQYVVTIERTILEQASNFQPPTPVPATPVRPISHTPPRALNFTPLMKEIDALLSTPRGSAPPAS